MKQIIDITNKRQIWTNFVNNRGIRKEISKLGERYIQWAIPLYENEAKGTFFVLMLFSDSPIETSIYSWNCFLF